MPKEIIDGLQAITVKFLGHTNKRPSRLKATAAAKSLTVSYGYTGENEYREVAEALMAKLGWEGDLYQGCLPNGDRVFVQIRKPR